MANPNKAARKAEMPIAFTDDKSPTVTDQSSPGRKRAIARGKTIGQAPEQTPAQAQLKANAAKRKAEETEARKSNERALAAQHANEKPEPAKVLKVGSGSAIGVATGAMDGQPHTKRAVEEARASERDQAKRQGLIEARTLAGHLVYVKPTDPLLRTVNGEAKLMVSKEVAKKFDKMLADYKAGKGAWDKEAYGKAPAKDPTAHKAEKKAKPKPPVRVAAPQPDRKYKKGERKNEAKVGSWTHYMVATAQACKSTDLAKAAHAKSGQFADKKLDWKWMADKGYIAWQ